MLFAISSAIFCSMVAIIMKTPRRIAASIPPLTIVLLALSPVFLRILDTPWQNVLPTYTYIYRSVDTSFVWIMCIYIPIGLIICEIASALQSKLSKKAHYFAKKQEKC